MQSPRRIPAAVASSEAWGPSGCSILGEAFRELQPASPASATVPHGQGPGTGSPPQKTGAQSSADARVGPQPGSPRTSILSSCLILLHGPLALPQAPTHPSLPEPRPLLPVFTLLGDYAQPECGRGWGDPGHPAAPSLGLMLLAERSQQGGRWWLQAGGLPFQPESTCNWIHQPPRPTPTPRAQTRLH